MKCIRKWIRFVWKRVLCVLDRPLLWFDRTFSTHNGWLQLAVVAVLCVLCTVALWCLWLACKPVGGTCHVDDRSLKDVIRLILGATNYPVQGSAIPGWYQLLIAIVGTMVFTAFLISTLSNILTNRAASHRKGYLHYYFSNHVLILGGSKVAVGILNSIAEGGKLKKDVVILTNRDAEQLWDELVSMLPDERWKKRLMIYHGERNMEKALRYCQAELASAIYITGEDGEADHDSINVDCWKRLREWRETNAVRLAQCYLLLERNASAYLFNALPKEDTLTMETTIMNRLDSVAQQLLIGDGAMPEAFTLDRGAMEEKSDLHVHLVVVGMTQMGYALATTAAHLCHYPNFKEGDEHPKRTVITFIDPAADEEKKFFKGRYPGLFELSHSTYMEEGKRSAKSGPVGEYGDFLDVEWEFVKGTVVDEWVCDMLRDWRSDKKQLLTLAFCGLEAERNLAQALYLPREFYRYVDEKSSLDLRDPLIWVYQPDNSALIETAYEEVGRYANLRPFGTMTDSFDPLTEKRVAAAKRINYLYKKSGKAYTGMPKDVKELDAMWRELPYAEKLSSFYSANSIHTKLRCVGDLSKPIEEPLLTTLAKLEHARWNMEKLLVGFSALPMLDRKHLNEKGTKEEIDRLKKKDFKHKDIAPYDGDYGIPESSKKYDKAIVKSMLDVIYPQ